jgi:hypothetical protein
MTIHHTLAPAECAARAMYPETKAGGLDDDRREAQAVRFARTKGEARRIRLQRVRRGAARFEVVNDLEQKDLTLGRDA